ncbi:MAG TPA: DNA mismatch repair endonuclease MutL [Gammaproteobacteria bacterium]|nr:DNA mismatch repair endonuclease MutL [Gammaproteobacteria bacterium]
MKPASRVHILSPRLANQIAAGEVVERPASVLKELLENSLDSGAGVIRVDVERGGAGLIRVQDDGCGIHRDDLALAVSRHATSKIEKLSDLERLSSMGFRGEALASIASVARFRIVSRSAEMETAWCLEVAGSAIEGEPVPQPREVGTTVEVRDLFFNTPVRRRFLRSERTEQGHLDEVFKRVALSRFDIRFTFHNSQRCVYRLHPCTDRRDRERRLAQLCGKGFLEHALHIEFEASGMRLHGWLATPKFARSQTDTQYFYLNGRAIRDRLVNHAIRQAYRDRLYEGRHPAYVLFLEMAPEQVDVNVHPTKHEVRFREARLVHDFLLSCLEQALGRGEVDSGEIRGSEAGDSPSPLFPKYSGASPGRHKAAAVKEEIELYKRLHEPAAGGGGRVVADDSLSWGLVEDLFGCYALVRQGERYLLVEIQPAREMLFRERLGYAQEAGGRASQPLLLPQQVELEPASAAALERFGKRLLELGLEVTLVSPDSAVVRRLPAPLAGCDVTRLVPSLLTELAHAEKEVPDLCGLLAHHGAAFAPRPSRDQLQELLYDVQPLVEGREGQHVFVELCLEDLHGLFLRIRG